MEKRGQFFILASVILSLSIFSMAFTINEVVAYNSGTDFRDFADNVERETNGMLDYFVYSGVDSSDIEPFVDILQSDFRNQERGGNFMFIYGNSSRIVVRNLGVGSVLLEGYDEGSISGASSTVESDIRLGGFTVKSENFRSENTELVIEDDIEEEIEILFNGQVYKFPITRVNQVIFIIQKDIEDETFVEVR